MENQNDGRRDHTTIDIISSSPPHYAEERATAESSGSKFYRGWILFQFLVGVFQIIVSIVVLWWSKAKHENPAGVRVQWLEGYICGCLLLLPLLCLSYGIHGAIINWVSVVVEVLKTALGCFFAVWFVFGSMWILGSSSKGTQLDTLCQILLRFGCVMYAIPTIISCCSMPSMISSAMAAHPTNLTRAATTTADRLFKPPPTRVNYFINALPTYRFKFKETGVGVGVGVLLVVETEHERLVSEADATCCICLGEYGENDEVRELPCCHFFHKECVDEWLKINARCPLCQYEIATSLRPSTSRQ